MAAAFLLIQRQRQRQILNHKEILRDVRDTDPFGLTEEVFRGKYRLSKHLARSLIEELSPYMPHTERRHALTVQDKVLCALHFFGHGCYQKPSGNDRGFSQVSVSRALTEVILALNVPGILGQHIMFPDTEEKIIEIERNFRYFNIPGVLGYVDGAHVAIKAPNIEPEIYINRKRFHSLNVQIICNGDHLILDVVAGFPGSTHDAYIWRGSAARDKMTQWHRNNAPCWLLGDSGYPLEPWLLTPVVGANPGTPEAHYTRRHMSARNTVERCIGVLKSRFRCLLRHRTLAYEPLKCGLIVNACCILHNLCIRGHIPAPHAADVEEEVPVVPCVAEPRMFTEKEKE